MEFFQLMWSKGNNPSNIEFEAKAMGENDLPKLFVGVAHVNPGGWTYTEGWEPLIRTYSKIMDFDTQVRERAAAAPKKTSGLGLGERLARLAPAGIERNIWFAGFGGALVLGGGALIWRTRRGRDGN
ncbi:MAG: hypothetical protein LC121_07735 [Anaerolineae bacterium]|nr:hypothetical protein [Anaerolineae bacterium]